MKLHLPKGLLVAVLAAMTGFTQSAWGAYETLADQTHEAGSIPTHSTSVNSLTHLVYDNNPSDGRVVSNANIVVNGKLWVGPGANNTHNAAQRPILVQMNGIISGGSNGRFRLNEFPNTATDHFVIYELTNSASSLDGTIALESGDGSKHADAQLNFAGVGSSAYAKTTVDVNGPSCGIINIAGNTSLGGLTGTQGCVTSTSTSNTLTLAGTGTYSYTGTLGSGSYHTYTLGDSSTTFGTAESAALNIVKSGTGTQTFTGTANLGAVTVEAGILNLNGATTFNGNISVADDAALNIYSAVTLNGSVTGALSIVYMSGFQGYGQSSDSCTGGEVEGNGFLSDTYTIISSDSTTKEGVSIAYKGETYTTNAAGAITTQNKDVFYIRSGTEKLSFILGAGAETIQTSAGTVLNIDTNDTTAGNHILPSVSGSGTVEVKLADNNKKAAITGTSFAGFTGTVDVKTGQLYVGNYDTGDDPGADATVNAEKIIVRSGAALWTHLGKAGRTLSSDIDLLSGSALRNRDGSSTLSGDIRFNIKDPSAETPEYDSAGSVELSTHWEKDLTLTGSISGDGQVNITTPVKDEPNPPASTWKLTNNGNTFQGSYNLAGRTKLILGAENAARNATINLNADASTVATLELAQNATIKALNSKDADSVVTTTAAATLTVSEGSFAGILRDGSTANKLSLKKTGTGTLTLSGANTYTGTTTIENGILALATGGEYTLVNSVSGAGTLQVESGTTLLNNSKSIASKLVLNGGNATLSGECVADGDITVKNGSTLGFADGDNDILNYNKAAVKWRVETGGTIDYGNTRQAFGANSTLELAGGRVTGTGDGYGALDMTDNATVTIHTTADSDMDATVRLRDGATIKFEVDKDKTLSFGGVLKNRGTATDKIYGDSDGGFTKTGEGTMKITSANIYSGTTTVSKGILETANAAALGTGKVSLDGGVLKLAAALRVSAMDCVSGSSKVQLQANNLEVTGTLSVGENVGMQITGTGTTTVNTLQLNAGASISTEGALSMTNLSMGKGSSMAANETINLNNGTLTLGSGIKLTGTLLTAEALAAQDKLALFSGITQLNFTAAEGVTYNSSATVAYYTVDTTVDLTDVFSVEGVEEGMYELTFSEGTLWASQMVVPEPATATLSLLALAGLCARRRRKS